MKNPQQGFTLIELLVVIAIIAILAAILFPVFAKVREKARQTACLSNEKQIGLGIAQYVEDYDETTPCGAGLQNYNNQQGWAGSVAPYLKSSQIFTCPDDSTVDKYLTVISYGLNANLADNPSGAPVSLSKFVSPTKTVLLFELNGALDDVTSFQNDQYSPVGDGVQLPLGCLYSTGPLANVTIPAGKASWYVARHTNGSNYLYADGHVKWQIGANVSAGHNNTTSGDPGTSGVANGSHGGAGNYVSSVVTAANTENSTFSSTFSYN
jgi:prepilin-type N-terminal cleavage/methylation domain-containing protein/prepilin-type processing-associated H-X9-DG protein